MSQMQFNLEDLHQPAQAARDYIFEKSSVRPDAAIVLGSGIDIFNELEDVCVIPFGEIPGFPHATVKGHKGELTLGRYQGKNLAIFRGRIHRYEGHPWRNVVFPVTLMHAMGIKDILMTNAAGGIHRFYTPGDLVLIRDHFYWQPLSEEERSFLYQQAGNRIHFQYSPDLISKAQKAAVITDVPLRQGIYCCLTGPTYETHAELIQFARMSVDIVGMSTVPEALWGFCLGMNVMAISCVTNVTYDTGALAQTSHEEVVTVAQQSSLKLERLLQQMLTTL
jgi:purine-nucleoside phosphorylase